MFKKIIVLVSLITLSVLVMAEIELLTIRDMNYIETVQARNLRAVRNSESIRSNIVDLEHNVRNHTYYQDDKDVVSFWKNYKTGANNLDQLTSFIHAGDCKGCHQAYAVVRSERQFINDLFSYNSTAINTNLKNSYFRDQLLSHTVKLKNAMAFINTHEKLELKQAKEDLKKLEDKTDFVRLEISQRVLGELSVALPLISSMETKVKNNDFKQAKQLFQKQEKAFKLPENNPSVSNDCYSCHVAISKLPSEAKAVADTAYTVFSTNKGTPQNISAIERFDKAITKFRNSTSKINTLSQTVLTKSMNDAKTVRKRFQLVTTTTTAITMLLTLIGAAMIIRWTRKRLSVFSAAIKAITEGDYSHTVRITSNDEFSDLARTFNIMVKKVNQTQASLKSLHLNTVKALIEAIEAKDPYTRGHSENVARYAMLLGNELKLPQEALDKLHAAALLHDIGKIGIREDVLNKPSRLSSGEYEHIKSHPAISAQIVGSIPNLALIANIIKHHHEHYDGKGYVDGLSGEDIPLESRILAIADTFDAMTSDRPYRKSSSKQKAFSELRKCSGKQFDPKLVELFIQALKGVRIKKNRKKTALEQGVKSIIA